MTLLKVGVRGESVVTLQSKEPVWLGVHWTGAGTLICPGGGCDFCVGEEPRISGFLLGTIRMAETEREVPVMFEVSSSTWDRFRGLAGGWDAPFDGSGWVVSLSRTGKRRGLLMTPVTDHGVLVPELRDETRLLRAIGALMKLPMPVGPIDRQSVYEPWRFASLQRMAEEREKRAGSKGGVSAASRGATSASNGR